MVISLDARNLEETARYLHSLFPGETRRVKHKIVSFGDKEFDLELFASEAFAAEALEARHPGALFSGTFAFDLKPAYRRGAHKRRAKLQFNIEKNALESISLQYTYGKLDLYLDWYLEAESEPPSEFAAFVEEGEALNRKYEADPNVDRDVSNIQNLHLFPVFRKTPFFGIFEKLYNEIMARLLKPVEHEELHTDIGGYDEALALAEEERVRLLTEGYDPSIDFGPLEEAEEAERLDLTDVVNQESGYYRLAELLKEAGFRTTVKEVTGDLTLRAVKEVRHKEGNRFLFGMQFLIAPATLSLRPIFWDGEKNMDFVSRSLVLKRVPLELPYKIVTPNLSGEWSKHYNPDEAIPEFRKIYTEFLEVINTPVAHHELHGDLAGYEEASAKPLEILSPLSGETASSPTGGSTYDEAIAADCALEEAVGLYKGPEFDRTRWEPLGKELEAMFRHELTFRIDLNKILALTMADSSISFNRGAANSNELIQIIITTAQIDPEFSVHLYGDELTPENIPRTFEEVLNFPDAYFVGGSDAQNRVMGHAEPGEVKGFLTTFRIDPEAPNLEKFYEEFINRLFAEVQHEELHTDVGTYDETRKLALLSEPNPLLSESPALLSEEITEKEARRIGRELEEEGWIVDSLSQYLSFYVDYKLPNGIPQRLRVIINFSGPSEERYTDVHWYSDYSSKSPKVFACQVDEFPSFEELLKAGLKIRNPEFREKWDAAYRILNKTTEHAELHTDVGAYDEGLGKEINAFLLEEEVGTLGSTVDLSYLTVEDLPEIQKKLGEAGFPDSHLINLLKSERQYLRVDYSEKLDLGFSIEVDFELTPVQTYKVRGGRGRPKAVKHPGSIQYNSYIFKPGESRSIDGNSEGWGLNAVPTEFHTPTFINIKESEKLQAAFDTLYQRYLAALKPVEHFELHGDIGGYDESLIEAVFDNPALDAYRRRMNEYAKREGIILELFPIGGQLSPEAVRFSFRSILGHVHFKLDLMFAGTSDLESVTFEVSVKLKLVRLVSLYLGEDEKYPENKKTLPDTFEEFLAVAQDHTLKKNRAKDLSVYPDYKRFAALYAEAVQALKPIEHEELHTDIGNYDESLLKEAIEEKERYYGIATGDGNSGVSRMSPEYIVLTNKAWDLAELAAFAAFKDDPAIQEWVGKNMEIDGDSEYGIYVTFLESMEAQAEREAAQEEYEKRRAEAEAAGEEFEEEDPSEQFNESSAWFIIEIFPIPASEINDYRCDVFDNSDHPDFLDPLYPIIGHEELHTDIGTYDESLLKENVNLIDFSDVSEEQFSEAIEKFKTTHPEAKSSVGGSSADWQDLSFDWASAGFNRSYPRGSIPGSFYLTLEWDKRWGSLTDNYTGGAFRIGFVTSRANLKAWFTDRHLPQNFKAYWMDWAAKHQPNGARYAQTDAIKRVTRKQWAAAEIVWDKILASLSTIEHEELHTDIGTYDEAIMDRLKEAREVLIDSRAVDEAIAWAKVRFGPQSGAVFVHDSGPRRAVYFHFCAPEDLSVTLKTKPSASVKFQFGLLPNNEEHLVSIILNYRKPEAYSGGDPDVGIVDIVEGYPIPGTFEELEKEMYHKYADSGKRLTAKFRRLKFFPEIREAFEGFIERIFEPVGHEELHTDVGNYEEAAKRKIPTEDISQLIPDYETAKAIADRLEAIDYFSNVISRFGTVEVSQRWDFERYDKSVFGQDWWEQGFKNLNFSLVVEQAGNRTKRIGYFDKVLRIEVMVYGAPSEKEKEKAKRAGQYQMSYYWHKKKSVFPAKAAPVEWPGIILLAPSLDAEVRARASELCAEAYGKFIEGLFPNIRHEELHTDIEGYDESLTEAALPQTPEERRIKRILDAAEEAGISFDWEHDEDPDLSWMDEKERAEVREVLICIARQHPEDEEGFYDFDAKGEIVASLSGIVDPDRAYARSIEADLAIEAGVEDPGEPPPEHEELHTDIGPYDEALSKDRERLASLNEVNTYIAPETEVLNLKEIPETEIKAAYDRWCALGGDNVGYGYREGDYALFGRYYTFGGGDKSQEIDVAINIGTVEVEIGLVLYPGDLTIKATVYAVATPLDADPLLRNLIFQTKKILEDDYTSEFSLEEWTEGITRAVKSTWADWIRLWQPVEHEELHTDIGAYDESIS